jgi:hypothetical protein
MWTHKASAFDAPGIARLRCKESSRRLAFLNPALHGDEQVSIGIQRNRIRFCRMQNLPGSGSAGAMGYAR